MSPAGRHSACDRACRRANAGAFRRKHRGAPRRPVPLAERRRQDRAPAPADTACADRLELRAPGRRGARALPASCRFPGRFRARSCGSGGLRERAATERTARRPDAAGRKVAGRPRSRERAIPDARDGAAIRARAARLGRADAVRKRPPRITSNSRAQAAGTPRPATGRLVRGSISTRSVARARWYGTSVDGGVRVAAACNQVLPVDSRHANSRSG